MKMSFQDADRKRRRNRAGVPALTMAQSSGEAQPTSVLDSAQEFPQK